MMTYVEVDVYIHIFFTSALVVRKWSALRPFLFSPEKEAPRAHWIRGWVGPHTRSGQRWEDNIPARSQSLYRLRYPGSHIETCFRNIGRCDLAQDKDQLRALVDTVVDYLVLLNLGKFLGSWATGGLIELLRMLCIHSAVREIAVVLS
jgi:hypothetical protein